MFRTLIDAFKQKDLRNKILLTLFILLVYRIGCWIPVPGIEPAAFDTSFSGESATFLGLLSSITGGALSNGALLALGVIPYISASIIMQLLTIAIPSLERLSKSGDEGRKKIGKITRWAALILSTAQAIAIVIAFSTNGAINTGALGPLIEANVPWLVAAIVAAVLIAGGMFTLWLGEKITDLKIGNGVSLLIFVGILASAGQAILQSIQAAVADIDKIWSLIIFLGTVILIFGLIVFIDLAERRIPVQYAKQIKGRKMYGGQNTHIPIKVNSSGVLPLIFATALVAFPQLLMSIFWPTSPAFEWYSTNMGMGSWPFFVVTAILIFFFTYFYSQIAFNPEDVSRSLQQNGGFVQGYRAGKPTADYLKKISSRITFFGATYLAFIFIIPSLAFKSIQDFTTIGGSAGAAGLVTAFSVTGLLIVVSVALEFDKQLNAQMMMKNYRGFLK
ncbi:MAG: preprotein translocase subunit SecY [Firmicutes bacterium]|nr:preprotein translocase subunit SecY [Bacillota bacterium]